MLKDDVWKVIDPEGNELFTVPSGYVPENEPLFQNGISMLYNKDWDYYEDYSAFNVLVINKDFSTKEVNVTFPDRRIGIKSIRPIITPEFTGFLLFSTKTIQGGYQREGSEYYYIDIYDLNGNSIWRVEFEDSYNFESSYRTFNESGCCQVDSFPEILEPYWLFEAQNGYINVVDNNDKWGLFNLKTKKLTIPCKYDYVGVASDDGVVNVCSYGKWGYIDINNNTLLKPQFKYTGELQNGRAFAKTEEGKNVIIDKNGNILSEITTDIRIGHGSYASAIIANSEKTGIFISASSNTRRYLTTTVFDSTGKHLVSAVQSESFYVSDKYIFLDGKMYKIIK